MPFPLRSWSLVLLCGATLLPATSAQATSVTFGFTAQVSSVDDPMNLFGGAFDGSPTLTGQYTFDSNASGIPSGPGRRYLAAFDAPLSFTVNGILFAMDPAGATNNMIDVQNDAAVGGGFLRDAYDPFLASSSWTIDGVGQSDVLRFDLSLGIQVAGVPDLLDSNDLPLTPPDIFKAADRSLEIAIFQAGSRAATVSTTLTALVPEPSTALLLACGLVGMAASGRRRAPGRCR